MLFVVSDKVHVHSNVSFRTYKTKDLRGQQIIQGFANRILQLEEISEEERDTKHKSVSNNIPRFRAVSQKDTDEMIEKQRENIDSQRKFL